MYYMKTHFQPVKATTLQSNQEGLPEFMRKALVKLSNDVEKKVLTKMENKFKQIIEQTSKKYHIHANKSIDDIFLEESIQEDYWWMFLDFVEEFQKENVLQILNLFNVTTLSFSKVGGRKGIITSVIEGKYVLSIITKWQTAGSTIEQVKSGYPKYESALMAFDNDQIREQVYKEEWGYDPPESENYSYDYGCYPCNNITELFNHLSEIV